jgi:putative addiction module component (TIGR02574 family)
MSSTAKRLLDEALALSAEEREALADALHESLEPREHELDAAWRDEIARRIAAVERGESKLVPGPLVEERVRARLRDG